MESAKGNEIKKSEAFYSRELCRIILSSSKEQDIETFVKNTPSLHNNEVILKAAINTSWRGRRPLDLAVEKGDKKSVKFLIDKKAETSYKNFNGVTPLLLACQMEPTNMEVIECLLEKSTSAEIVDELGNTVLHFVCQKEKSNLPLIQLLLMKQDAPVSKENHKKETPLLCVLRYTKKIDDDVIEILDTLLSHPSAPSELILRQAASDGQTPLHVACLRGKPARAAVQFLLDKKADPNFEDNNKIRPIHCACLSEKPDIIIIKLLIESKAIVAVKTQNEDSILHLAASNSNCDSAFIMKVIDILFKHGSELMDSKNSFGMTALRAACLLGNAEVVTALINKITQRQERRKELEFACKAGCIDYIKTNLQKNNRENLLTDTESGPGLLQIAIENNQKSIATEILKCEVWKLALKEQWSPQLNIRSFPTILSALSEKYPDLGLQVCDQCITYNQDQKLASFEYEFFYDNSKHSTPFTRSNSPSLLFPFNRSQGEFFNHPLVEAFSSHKWSYVRNFYLMILFFDAIFVIGFTAYMFATPAPFYPINQTLWKMNKSCVYVKKSGNIHTTSDLSQIMQIILFVCSLVELAKIIFSVTRRTNKWEKLKQLDTIAESLISTMVALGTCPFLPKEYCDYWTAPLPVWQWIMCTIAFCPAWGQFALFYRKMAYANYQLIVHLKASTAFFLGKVVLTVVGFSLAFFALSKFGNFGQVACSLFVVILGASNFCEESNPPDDISSYFLLIATIFFFVYLIIAKINTILFSDAISDTTEKLEIAKMRQNAMQIQLVIEFEKNPIVNYFLDSFDQDYWRITEDLETEILRTDRFDSEFFKRATKQFEVRTTSILEIQNVNYKFSQPWKQLEREENSAL